MVMIVVAQVVAAFHGGPSDVGGLEHRLGHLHGFMVVSHDDDDFEEGTWNWNLNWAESFARETLIGFHRKLGGCRRFGAQACERFSRFARFDIHDSIYRAIFPFVDFFINIISN